MAKVTLKIPEIQWRKETMVVPEGKIDVVKEALRSRQDRITSQLAARNQEIARKLDEAARASSGSGRSKWVMLGLGSALGAGIGLALAPSRGKATRARLSQGATRAARQVGATAQAARSKLNRNAEDDSEPDTISHRVQTELGEDKVLGTLPRLNINAEPGGVVYLRGTVPGEDERERAEKLARKQRGVTQVINELTISDSMR